MAERSSNGDVMAQMISGRDSVRQIDSVIAQLRTQVADAIEAADEAQARRTQVRQEQVMAYRALADLRLSLLSSGQGRDSLMASERKALDLLAAHEDHVAENQRKLDAAAAEILRLEEERADLADKLDLAVSAYEDKVEQIEARLHDDPDYQALSEAFEDACAVSERAHSKLAVAEKDRQTKGQPYENDPLFSYLWKRKFRQPSYSAFPFFRFLDGWVADLCDYDNAWLNYKRLTELPLRLREHAQRKDADRDAAEDALEAAEAAALQAGGADELKEKADSIRDGVAGLDHLIAKHEATHQELAQGHEDALAAQTGPGAQARQVLEHALREASFPDLRVLASQTIDREDDRLVDQLVKLRAEEMEFELASREVEERPRARRRELDTLEGFRRAFKSANYDSPYASFRGSAIDAAISGLLRGGDTINSAMRYVNKNMRRTKPRVDPGFGGGRRADTLGLPGILGDIAIEIAKEAARSGSYGGGYRGSTKRSSGGTRPTRRTSPPRLPGSSRRGGFKTGGGF
ncbi:MAG: hypothetical protein CME88_08390 [Hirschia sp.]|nr:hypothetical protein [Hirschia sp.]MBF18379.1 hypothetical protein [Hirschia sp.]